MTKIVAHLVLGLLFLCANALAGPYDDGVAAYDQGQYAAALKWWLPLAEQGHAAAQFNVAVLYEKGLGTAVDHAEAARWYLKAAQQGDPDAQYNVALFYETGTGVAKDVDQARNWYAEVLANRRAKADSPVRQRATAHLKALSTQEVIAFDEGRFVIANADAQTCV
ncbi:MAG TPA: tetratricopeptide repeat protein, partial [Casimicrobiaceae bacterium]|nr:tetratricopeptide repeat protein [Casimicrobiaceae bacterium]